MSKQQQQQQFKFLTYNVLADQYANTPRTRGRYPHVSDENIDWQFRCALLQQQFKEFNADIICLQVP